MGNSSDMESMRTFADQLWKYMVPKINAKLSSNVSYFRAEVVSNPGNNKLEVQRPVENGTLTLPCVDSVAHAQPGQQVVALVMGSMSNAIVIGDGKLNPPLSTYGPASTVTLEAGKGGMPFIKLVSDITAVQEGSGDPSPENVRPITGFIGMNLHLNDKVFPVSFGSAGTVYGGALDVLTGTLTVDRAAVDMGDLNWSGSDGYFVTSLAGRKIGKTADGVFGISSRYDFWGNAKAATIYSSMPDRQFGFQTSNSNVRLKDSSFAETESLKAALDGQKLVYPLENPVTYQLTPQLISSLPGQNNIWSDTGDVTVEYGNFIQAMQKEIESLHR